MTQSGSYTLITLAPLLVILIGLGITVTFDPYINRGQRGVLLLIVVLTFRVVLKDGIGYLLATKIVNIPWRTWNSVVGYTVRPVILLLFLYVIGMKRRTWPFWLLIGVNALIHLTALVSDRICFGFPENVFHRGPLGFTSHVVSGILLVYLLFRTYREYSRVKRSEMEKGVLRVRPDMFLCDAYRFYSGESDAVNAYRGEYMSSYSWASMTEGILSWRSANQA
ncbi:MAG: hypothetical protein IKT99_00505 [Oscillospiraceae bacterium]|nr:hypothetical protein [Oscillospiraceae bacterium]